jgi:hypothetical protein
MKWKQAAVTLTLVVSLMTPPAPFHVMEQSAMAAGETLPTPESYSLTPTMSVTVKSVLNEPRSEGTRMGIVVRMTNEGTRLSRVPDYEVRVATEDGTEYTLRASAANPIAIQPKETVELSYMIVVEREELFSLSHLKWVDVDDFGYPKKETEILAIPVGSQEWKGSSAFVTSPVLEIPWGESFTIPNLSGELEYKPVSMLEQSTAQGQSTILELLVTNTSDSSRAIPEFRIDAGTDRKAYTGKRLEQEALTLESGEQRHLHYAIPAGIEELKSLTVLTPEQFDIDDSSSVTYTIGRLRIALAEDKGPARLFQLPLYDTSWPIRFDPLNKVVPAEVNISLKDLRMHESVGGGFRAVVAKLKLENRGDKPMPVPSFQTQLISSDGKKYTGTRQTAVADSLIPNISYIMYYSFVLPSSIKGDQLVMELLDGTSITPYQLPLAHIRTKVMPETDEDTLAIYPYNLKMNSWGVEVYYGASKDSMPYTYKLKMDLDIALQDEALVDQSFPKLKVKLVNKEGKVIGSAALPFTGENRVVSGLQTVSLASHLFDFNYSLHLYETVNTPFGETERLVKIMK